MPELAMAVLPVAVNPVVEYTLAVHPAAEPRASVTSTVPSAPVTVPPGVVVPPLNVADAGTATLKVPPVVVNVTVLSAAFAGIVARAVIAAAPRNRSEERR